MASSRGFALRQKVAHNPTSAVKVAKEREKNMAPLGPWLGGSRGGHDSRFGSPFSSDIWDPFGFWQKRGQSDRGDESSALANAHVDWRETDTSHEFRVDLPG